MSRLTKFMLALLVINSVASALFLTGTVNISAAPGLYVVFPLAAIFYGMVLICRMLEKDATEFDADKSTNDNHVMPVKRPRNVESFHDREHHKPVAA